MYKRQVLNGNVQGEVEDMNHLARSLRSVTPARNNDAEAAEWDAALVQALGALHSIGIMTIQDMVEWLRPDSDVAYVKPASHLKQIAQRTEPVGEVIIKPEYKRAWNIITRHLVKADADSQPRGLASHVKPSDMPYRERVIPANICNKMRQQWPDRHSYVPYTVRTEAGTKYKTNISQKTGLAQYEHLLPGTQQQKRAGRSKGLNASLLRLYTEYSHRADVIESVARVCSNKLPTRKSRCTGSKKRRKEEAHLQLVVQWAPSMQPRWIANVAILLGYT